MSDWDEAEKNFDLNVYFEEYEKQRLASENYSRKMSKLRYSEFVRKYNYFQDAKPGEKRNFEQINLEFKLGFDAEHHEFERRQPRKQMFLP